ncbi:hypothetical protein BAR24_10050 [Gluconobacter oxydans]|nr:hypothetical protein BAR24_10050 [Gluconobacter oxydans]
MGKASAGRSASGHSGPAVQLLDKLLLRAIGALVSDPVDVEFDQPTAFDIGPHSVEWHLRR